MIMGVINDTILINRINDLVLFFKKAITDLIFLFICIFIYFGLGSYISDLIVFNLVSKNSYVSKTPYLKGLQEKSNHKVLLK